MAPFDDENEKRRWLVKDSIYSRWRELPGTHTGAEVWAMLNRGRFLDAMPADEAPPEQGVPDD